MAKVKKLKIETPVTHNGLEIAQNEKGDLLYRIDYAEPGAKEHFEQLNAAFGVKNKRWERKLSIVEVEDGTVDPKAAVKAIDNTADLIAAMQEQIKALQAQLTPAPVLSEGSQGGTTPPGPEEAKAGMAGKSK